VLMDLEMPVMDGYAAAAAIRRGAAGRRDIPILALTAAAKRSTSTRSSSVDRPCRMLKVASRIAVILAASPAPATPHARMAAGGGGSPAP